MNIVTKVAHTLQRTFGECAEQANRETNVVKRHRKFSASTLAQAFVLALLQKPRANSEDIAMMASACGVNVSPQAIDQRYSPELAAFFRSLVGKLIQCKVRADQTLAPMLQRFTEVKLIDSTSLQLPDSLADEFPSCGGRGNGGYSVMKLQTELDLRSGQIQCLQPEPGNVPDQGTDRQHVTPTAGSLRIGDLGYFSIPVLIKIDTDNAYFLSRIQYVIRLFVDGKKHSLVPWLNGQAADVIDRRVEIGTEHRFACRLIAWRVPQPIADRRRAKLRATSLDKYGREPTKESLAACDWEFLVTNLSQEQLSVTESIVLHRSRWQIELLFKRWKSTCGIGLRDSANDNKTMVRMWARLCAAVVQHWLVVSSCWCSDRLTSFSKVTKLIRVMIRDIALSMNSLKAMKRTISTLAIQATRACKRTKRKRKPGTIEMLRNPESLDYDLNFTSIA